MVSITSWIANLISKIMVRLPYDFFDEGYDSGKYQINVEKAKNNKFGDFSTNWVLTLGLSREKADYLGNFICDNLDKKYFSKITYTAPGFINFTLSDYTITKILNKINSDGKQYGLLRSNKKIVEIEFVSANPTGKLHIGHARNAAIGDTLGRILESQGYKVIREYYINDAGNQIDKLALSVLVRYRQSFGLKDQLPEDSYHADEVIDAAKALRAKYDRDFLSLTHDELKIKDTGANERKLIEKLKDFSKHYMLQMIKKSLASFGVNFNIWFPESEIYRNKLINKALTLLKPYTYKQDNATWLKTTAKGDDKDRVLIKSDGSYTYFLPDIAYHVIKMSHNYDALFNIWGADHKSYADRMKIAMELCGFDASKIHFIIMQMVLLTKNGQEFKMSKRSGQALTLDDLVHSIGRDATRWSMVSQPADSHLEIDVDMATNKDNRNSMCYVQYAHARINQLLEKNKDPLAKKYDLLSLPVEHEIIALLAYYPDTLRSITHSSNVNVLTMYLTNLAKLFHSYYGQVKIIDADKPILSSQRLGLVSAIKQVLVNGFSLLGISPMDKM